MADVMMPTNPLNMDHIDDDPEAIFDFITIRSMQERYGTIDSPRVNVCGHINSHDISTQNEAVYANETDFETFVQQFPIDDSIAECFATSNELNKKRENKFVSGGKRPQLANKYSKLKKKFGRKQSDETSLLSDEEIRTRETKRSKKAGGVFSKRHKWRNITSTGSKKSVNFSDQSEKSESDIVDDVFEDARSCEQQVLGKSDVTTWGSFSASDSQITSFSETLTRMRSENSQTHVSPAMQSTSRIPVRRVKSLDPLEYNKDTDLSSAATGTDTHAKNELTEILTGTTSDMVSKIEDLSPEKALKLRDHHGNTLLHRCVLLGNCDIVKYLLEKFPEMTSDLNDENETAIELAAKTGRYECLKVMLERSQRRNGIGSAMVNRLLNVCAQNGQAECMTLLLVNMSRDPHPTFTLPGDARGNTAAHLAAKHGHLQCLHTLVSSGYDVTTENLLQQRPLHVAHQSRSQHCFEYLLLLDICRELFFSLKAQTRLNARLVDQLSCSRSSTEHVRKCLTRYDELCKDTNESLSECKSSIIDTLRNLQTDLELCVTQTSAQSHGLGTRDKIKELNAEIERLEDTFDFSPFAEMDEVLAKLYKSLDEAMSATSHSPTSLDQTHVSPGEEESKILGSLIKDIHREYILENWSTGHIYEKHTSAKRDSPLYTPIIPQVKSKIQDINTGSDVSGTRDSPGNTTPVNQNAVDMVSLNVGSLKCGHGRTRIKRKPHNNATEKPYNSAVRHEKPTEVLVKTHEDKTLQEEHVSEKPNEKVIVEDSDKENKEKENPTERPFTKLLSLDERIDLLIAGEREKERDEDGDQCTTSSESRGSCQEPPSLYNSTFTSITSDASSLSDWYNRLGLVSLESNSAEDMPRNDVSFDATTSDTASYWWDAAGDKQFESPRDFKVSVPYNNEIRRRIHLNLENDGSSCDELRQQRLVNHLKAVHQTRYSSEKYRERITTSTGEIIGGFQGTTEEVKTDRRVLVDVNGALRSRKQAKPIPKPRKRGKPKLFTLEDAIATKAISEAEFREQYDRSRDPGLHLRWENMSMTDDEDRSLTWSDYGRYGLVTPRSDNGTSDSSRAPPSLV